MMPWAGSVAGCRSRSRQPARRYWRGGQGVAGWHQPRHGVPASFFSPSLLPVFPGGAAVMPRAVGEHHIWRGKTGKRGEKRGEHGWGVQSPPKAEQQASTRTPSLFGGDFETTLGGKILISQVGIGLGGPLRAPQNSMEVSQLMERGRRGAMSHHSFTPGCYEVSSNLQGCRGLNIEAKNIIPCSAQPQTQDFSGRNLR